jgi:small subunit ribosomal protein S6
MNQYESMYILKPDMEEEARKALIQKFANLVTENGGKLEKVDEWGQRKLAYEINYIKEGYYVLMTFEAPSEFPVELERNYKISDSIIRFNVIRL